MGTWKGYSVSMPWEFFKNESGYFHLSAKWESWEHAQVLALDFCRTSAIRYILKWHTALRLGPADCSCMPPSWGIAASLSMLGVAWTISQTGILSCILFWAVGCLTQYKADTAGSKRHLTALTFFLSTQGVLQKMRNLHFITLLANHVKTAWICVHLNNNAKNSLHNLIPCPPGQIMSHSINHHQLRTGNLLT